MKKLINLSILTFLLTIVSCSNVEDNVVETNQENQFRSSTVNFQHKATVYVGGEGASEISAFDSKNNKLFVVNVASTQISVYNLTDLDNIIEEPAISLPSGAPNSVAVHNGKLAVAVEADTKQNPGSVLLFDTDSGALIASYTVGALPDMVTFSPNGQFIVSANEGEPNDEYTVDPDGTISIIEVVSGNVTTLGFDAFAAQQENLEANGFRVFGPNASFTQDIEPEYVAISDNSNYAWVTLQENNGVAKVNLLTKTIEAIYPLGFKDFNMPGNAIDVSDRDDAKVLANWPVFGVYMPDAIEYIKVNGTDYIITANEGDSRDYDGFSEEARIKDDNIILDPVAFPDAEFLKEDENLGRLKITTSLGDTDNDGDYDELYSYGGRSFTVWNGNGQMVYDSANDISQQTLNLTPDTFNDDDGRSDDKGAEPEAVEVLKVKGNKYVLFVGLERTDQVLVYDITNPMAPEFMTILSTPGDEAPEGLLAVPSKDSPNGKDLLIVSNEDSGTVTIYENRN
ncbi:alkaline phosphatase [Hanstruepera neustonica]|uniref:Alkaline phosphatase n=1 Tax=Hanstruepera neustonica TaxID=1445657 RepID=A0A2K1E1B3_9FLAO|nr:choice-of-anchor I family protein [Hanstruepera neustonica]PNQ74065.1 alkaline phosphatase [Hanstruepera neustonica]